jgi:hypothetical protein
MSYIIISRDPGDETVPVPPDSRRGVPRAHDALDEERPMSEDTVTLSVTVPASAAAALTERIAEFAAARSYEFSVTEDDGWLERELAEALRQSEWTPPWHPVPANPFQCDWCGNFEPEGHAADCPRQSALAKYDAVYPETADETLADPPAPDRA